MENANSETRLQESNNILIILSSVLEAMKNVLPDSIEVVLHDLTYPESSVVNILNGAVTQRRKGDPLLSAPDDNDGFAGLFVKGRNPATPFVLSGYHCRDRYGYPLNSGSATFYDDAGQPVAVLAIHVKS